VEIVLEGSDVTKKNKSKSKPEHNRTRKSFSAGAAHQNHVVFSRWEFPTFAQSHSPQFLSKVLAFFWFRAKSTRLFLVSCENYSPFSGLTSKVLALFLVSCDQER
jgi:hypothetical protein